MSNFTQQQVNALTDAIAQGAKEVSFNGRRVVYSSLDEMIRLRDRMMRELQNSGDAPQRPLSHGSVFLKR